MQKCRKKVKSCLKQVNSNKALAGKVLQSLFTAGVVYVCIFGGTTQPGRKTIIANMVLI